MNHFERYPGHLLITLNYEGGAFTVVPAMEPSAETLIRASMLARDWSLTPGVLHTSIWSPDEQLVSRFIHGAVDTTIDIPNPYTGLL